MPIKWLLHWQPNAGTTVNSQILTEVSQCIESMNGTKGGRWKATLTFYRPILRDSNVPPIDVPRDLLGISLQEQANKYYFILRGPRIVLEADSSIQTIMEKTQSYKARVSLTFEQGFGSPANGWVLALQKVDQGQAIPFDVHHGNLQLGCPLDHANTALLAPWKLPASSRAIKPVPITPVSLIKEESELVLTAPSSGGFYREGFQYQLGDFQLKVGKVVPMNSENLRGIVMEVEYLPLSSLEKSRQLMEDFVDIWQETLSTRSLPGRFMHMETNFVEYGLSDHYSSQHTAVQYAVAMGQLIASVRN